MHVYGSINITGKHAITLNTNDDYLPNCDTSDSPTYDNSDLSSDELDLSASLSANSESDSNASTDDYAEQIEVSYI